MRKKAERSTRSNKKETQARPTVLCRTTRPISNSPKQLEKNDAREVNDPELANAIIVVNPSGKTFIHCFDCSIQSLGESFYLVLTGAAPAAEVRIVKRTRSFLLHYGDAAMKSAYAREAKRLAA